MKEFGIALVASTVIVAGFALVIRNENKKEQVIKKQDEIIEKQKKVIEELKDLNRSVYREFDATCRNRN